MSSDARDSIALYLIAATAVLVSLFADVDLGQVFQALLTRL